MKDKLKAFFTTDILWKLGALVAGLILWAVLSNVQDPATEKTISIPITYINEDLLKKDDGLVLLSGPQKTDINVTVRTSKAAQVNASQFLCKADLTMRSGGDPENQSVRIEVTQIGGEGIILDWEYLRNDPYVTVSLDRYVSKDFPVNMLWTDNVNDLQPEEVTFKPSVVTVYGPSSKFSNLAAVNVPMTLSDLTNGQGGEFHLDVGVKLYDLNGNELKNRADFDIDPETVSMTAKIANMKKLSVELSGELTGKPNEGFSVSSTEAEKKEVTVFSLLPIDAEKITIPLTDVDVSGLEETKTIKMDLTGYLPEGVYLSENERFLGIKVEIEAHVSKTFTLENVEFTGADDKYEYEFVTAPSVTCTADKSVLDELTEASFKPTVAVGDLEIGTHPVKVVIRRPENTLISENGLSVELIVREKGTDPSKASESESTGADD